MNSKKKLTALGFMFFFFSMLNVSFAQTFLPDPNVPGAFNLILPSLSLLNQYQVSPPPFYTFFLEWGNGRYKKIENEYPLANAQFTTVPKSISYDCPISNSKVILNVVGHYDTTPPPRRLHAIPNYSSSGSQVLTNQQNLPLGKNLAFDYSSRTVVPGDTMTVVLTYKRDASDTNNYIIAFFYNNIANGPGGKIFSEITSNLPYHFTGGDVNPIRTPNEVTTLFSAPTIAARNVSSTLATAKSPYQNAIYFMISYPYVKDIEEKNIFISLAPDQLNDTNYPFSSTSIKAIKIKYSPTNMLTQDPPVDSLLDIAKFARDPNGIITLPHCLNPAIGVNNQVISDSITFQNDGKGTADTVVITLKLPAGVSFPASLPNTCIVAGKKVKVFDIRENPDAKFSYDLREQGKITFRFNKIDLKGTDEQRKEIGRRGTISFKLKIIPPSVPSNYNTIPNCMYSTISIVFKNKYYQNRPIIAWDLVKKNCGFNCPPYTIPINTR